MQTSPPQLPHSTEAGEALFGQLDKLTYCIRFPSAQSNLLL